jgi:hypothetical protein
MGFGPISYLKRLWRLSVPATILELSDIVLCCVVYTDHPTPLVTQGATIGSARD